MNESAATSVDGELKIVFAGPMGAGKTTAIRAISDIEPSSTEVENNDRASFDKSQTTVALDFGLITLENGQVVRLYGTPGQVRFDFMWSIVSQGALGVILLLDVSQPDVLTQMDTYMKAFDQVLREGKLVIGLGRTLESRGFHMHAFRHRLGESVSRVPLLSVDVRRREDVVLLVSALLSQLEAAQLRDRPS